MEHRKPYCKEGESESTVAIAWIMVGCPVMVLLWFLLLWATGAINPPF